MNVTYIGMIPSDVKSFSRATFETSDGIKMEIINFLSEETIKIVEREACTAAKRKFTEAAQEMHLLEHKVISADDDCPF